MKQTMTIKTAAVLAMGFVLGAWATDATISDVAVRQRWPWSRLVDINYVLSCEETQLVDVAVTAYNGTTPLTLPSASLSGDLYGLSDGAHRIVWNPTTSAYTNNGVLTKFRVQLTPSSALPPTYMIVDLLSGDVTYHFCGTNLWADVTNDVYKTTKLVLRRIPAGTFMMGSPSGELGQDETREDYHSVTLTNDYWIGVYEVTQKQWFTLRSTNTSHFQVDGEKRPIEGIAYKNIRCYLASAENTTDPSIDWPTSGSAVADDSFMQSLRSKAGGGLLFDLPTDAEWEYACRAGTTGALNNGATNITTTSSCPVLGTLGRYQYNGGWANNGTSVPNADCGTTNATAVVGSYLPNAWGLYDMHGNVWEWCLDWYTGSLGTTAVTNPVGPVSGTERIRRGGSWYNVAANCRSADRRSAVQTAVSAAGQSMIGFRVVCPLAGE